jgi:hypothetical protein
MPFGEGLIVERNEQVTSACVACFVKSDIHSPFCSEKRWRTREEVVLQPIKQQESAWLPPSGVSDQALETSPIEAAFFVEEEACHAICEKEGFEFLKRHLNCDFFFHVKVKNVQQAFQGLFGNVPRNEGFLECPAPLFPFKEQIGVKMGDEEVAKYTPQLSWVVRWSMENKGGERVALLAYKVVREHRVETLRYTACHGHKEGEVPSKGIWLNR